MGGNFVGQEPAAFRVASAYGPLEVVHVGRYSRGYQGTQAGVLGGCAECGRIRGVTPQDSSLNSSAVQRPDACLLMLLLHHSEVS